MPAEHDGAWLRRTRERLGMTQAELAARLGLHSDTVSRMERAVPGYPVTPRTRLAVEALARARRETRH